MILDYDKNPNLSLDQQLRSLRDSMQQALEESESVLQSTSDRLTSRISDTEGNISTLEQTATSITGRIANAEGDISILRQTATSLTSRIGNAEGDISEVRQTATSLTSRIGTAEGSISTLQQTASGLSVAVAGKVGTNEVISKINASPESIRISSNKVTIDTGSLTIRQLGSSSESNMVITNSGISIRDGSHEIGSIVGEYGEFMCLYGNPTLEVSCGGNNGFIFRSSGSYCDSIGSIQFTNTDRGIQNNSGNWLARYSSSDSANIFGNTTDNTYVRGNKVYRSGSGTSFDSGSDIRLKKNMEPIEYASDVILGIDPFEFEWIEQNSDRYDGLKHFGVSAQKVRQLFEEHGLDVEQYAMLGEDNGYYTLTYGDFIPMLIKAIQDLNERIEDLERGSK